MADWMGRSRRDDEQGERAREARLTAEVERLATLCATLEDRLREADRRAETVAAALAARLDQVEGHVQGVLPLLTQAIVRRLEAERQALGTDALPITLQRLDREMKTQREEIEKIARALFERMELLRPRADTR